VRTFGFSTRCNARRSGAAAWAAVLCMAVSVWAVAGSSQPAKATDGGGRTKALQPFGFEVRQASGGTEAVVTGARVLLVQADDSTSPLVAGLLGYPDIAAVDVFDSRGATPTLPQLQAYDVVVTWCNYHPADGTALGDVLADYMDAGGKVIMAVFNWNASAGWATFGRFMSGGYCPFLQTNNIDHYATACLGTYDAGSPLMAGVASACDFYRDYVLLAPGATLVASWDDGEGFVAVKDCAVAINSYPGVYYEFSGDLIPLYHNAVTFLYNGCESYNASYYDDYSRSQFCVNTKTGAYRWNILGGAGAGTSYTGTASVFNAGAKFSGGAPNYLSVTVDPVRHKASGWFIGGGFYSKLADANTLNDPPGCQAPAPGLR
jgi:hypothetical protein